METTGDDHRVATCSRDEEDGSDTGFEVHFVKEVTHEHNEWNQNNEDIPSRRAGTKRNLRTHSLSSANSRQPRDYDVSPDGRKRQSSTESDEEPIIRKRSRLNNSSGHGAVAQVPAKISEMGIEQQISTNNDFLKRRRYARLQFQRHQFQCFLKGVENELSTNENFLERWSQSRMQFHNQLRVLADAVRCDIGKGLGSSMTNLP